MWYYNGKEFNETPEDFQGFVYMITDINTGRNISVKRTSGNQRYFPKQKQEREEYRTRTEY